MNSTQIHFHINKQAEHEFNKVLNKLKMKLIIFLLSSTEHT